MECEIDNQSFVYFDSPYRPLNKTSSFTGYSSNGFGDTDQIELASFFKKIDIEKGAKLMLSNSDPENENPDDDFFDNIFKNYNLQRILATRSINCKGSKRGSVNEILITNY